MKRLAMALLLLTAASTAAAQAPQSTATKPMEALSFLTGDWQGKGWIVLGPGQRHEFVETEHVQYKLGDGLLLIEGSGRDATDASQVIHDALAIVSWAPDDGRYSMEAYQTSPRGLQSVQANARMQDGAFVWSMEFPGAGQIRYTIRLNEKGQWYEVGEMSRDGGTSWNQFFGMTLDRQS